MTVGETYRAALNFCGILTLRLGKTVFLAGNFFFAIFRKSNAGEQRADV